MAEVNICKEDFVEIFRMLMAAYGDRFPAKDKTAANVWYQMLCDLQITWLQEAVEWWIKNNKYPPTIADVREVYWKVKSESGWQ